CCNFPTPGGVDLNGDGDAADSVVHLWPGSGPAQNLGLAATAVALSDNWLAALISEAPQGHTDLNGDGDAQDTVVEVHPLTGQPVSGDSWINVGRPADVVDVRGSVVAFITPECSQGGPIIAGCPTGGTDLNGDGDAADRVLQLYFADTGELLNV